MQAKDFNFDRYLRYREEKEAFLKKFLSGEYRGPVLTQRTCSEVFGVSANSKEASLEDWLNVLDFNMQLKGDVGFTYLEPWAGVPVYANAFGSPLFWTEITDVQSKPRYLFADEVANVPMPKAGECQMMQMVLEYIRYFKEQTHGLIPISLTDTQSPNDTASLILDPCELFAVSLEEPEALTDFMTKITQVIGDFSEMQIDAIGEELYVAPGHMMLSGSGLKGIALSDDNMAVVSPASYEVIGKPYNEMLSRRFGGGMNAVMLRPPDTAEAQEYLDAAGGTLRRVSQDRAIALSDLKAERVQRGQRYRSRPWSAWGFPCVDPLIWK